MLSIMKVPRPLLIVLMAASSVGAFPVFGQTAKPTKATKATKEIPPFTFEAHNEGSVEGAIYGDENLVTVTIDAAGFRYQSKSMDKPISIIWDQLSGWQANNFTSYSPGRAGGGDFGIGIYQGAHYLSFRTRNGRDYTSAIRALRALAAPKRTPR